MALPLPRGGQSAERLFREKFVAAWARTDEIFNIIPTGKMLASPIVWRHPFIFYVGHLPAFSWNQICGGILGWKSFNPYFDDLFCRGIDPDVDTGECHWHPEVPDEWPSLAATVAYRDRVRRSLLDAVETLCDQNGGVWPRESGDVLELVLEHEYMHQETLLYMLLQMDPAKKIRPRRVSRNYLYSGRKLPAVVISAGPARIGSRRDRRTFGWDNEFEEMTVQVPEFSIDSLPVTNGEFFQFVRAGGYDDRAYWRPEDWQWKSLEDKHCPACWSRAGAAWLYRAIFELLPLEKVFDWPVYVSLAEARAFAAWRGKRLPTEAEFHRAAYSGPDGRESFYTWGAAPATLLHGNFDFAAWSPVPVGSHPAGASRWGVHELVGNGWELTDTPFAPLPGFSPMAAYPDYSRDFFDGKHFVVKGASWATAAELLRPSFRNWYQARYPYVFAKFRCVVD
jgi:ergothioneine biosynthesis protein EgtB